MQSESRVQHSGTRAKLNALKPVVKSLITGQTGSSQVTLRSETAIDAEGCEAEERKTENSRCRSTASLGFHPDNEDLGKEV